jgi:hypothetical protein
MAAAAAPERRAGHGDFIVTRKHGGIGD